MVPYSGSEYHAEAMKRVLLLHCSIRICSETDSKVTALEHLRNLHVTCRWYMSYNYLNKILATAEESVSAMVSQADQFLN